MTIHALLERVVTLPCVGVLALWAMQKYRHMRLWLHRTTRDNGIGLASRIPRAFDPELGGAINAERTYGIMTAMMVTLCVAIAMYFGFVLIHAMLFTTVPDEVVNAIDALDYSRFMHTRHDAFEEVAELEIKDEIGPYQGLAAAIFANVSEFPPRVREPCRRLSKAEILAGLTTEGYEIPLLMMRMCEITHELVGCDRAGVMIPKLAATPDELNICIITYKDADGPCEHFINPTVRTVGSFKQNELLITSKHFPSIGKHYVTLATQAMVSYQPIVAEQTETNDAALSDALRGLEKVSGDQWLTTLPKLHTVVVKQPRAFHFQLAHAALLGEYPPELEEGE